MTKDEIIEKVNNTENLKKDKLLGWLRSLPSRTNIIPQRNKIGDVYMHPVFLHPYVLLKKKGDIWLCTLLTSEDECVEILTKCDSRFFYDSFVTKAIFTVSEIKGSYMGIYDNTTQLKKIRKELTDLFCS